jgi:N-acyl-D-amino-acid deacylase
MPTSLLDREFRGTSLAEVATNGDIGGCNPAAGGMAYVEVSATPSARRTSSTDAPNVNSRIWSGPPPAVAQVASLEMHDLVITGGVVHDGLGSPGAPADVAIEAGRVVGVGKHVGPARRTIAAEGRFVAPGFVDAHSHSDALPLMTAPQPFKLLQGVTTEVVGNCGFSVAPLDEVSARYVDDAWGDLLPGVSALPGSFADYLDRVEAAGPTNNIAPLVGHGTLRLTANGTRRDLSDEALGTMCVLAEEAFRAGAVGLSTGLIYVPATYADTDEIVAIARIAARWGRPYATHIRDEGERLGEALEEALDIGRRSGARVQVSHCKAFGPENRGKSTLLLDTLHRARAEGIDVRGDQYPYTASSTFLVTLLPSEASEGGVEELKSRCADPETLRRQLTPGSWGPTTAEDTVIIAHADATTVGRTVADIADTRALDPFAAVCALIAEDPGAMVVEHGMHDDDVVAIMRDPLIGVGSDNGAPLGVQHPRTWGCFPEFFGRFVRERGIIPWEEAIRKATSSTARQFGLQHRGTLQPGSIADICVFDPETIAHPGSYTEPDVTPVGIRQVVLGGTVVVDHGEFAGVRAGDVLRAGSS